MPAIQWIQWTERAVGENHPSLEDVVNRPLKELLIASGIDPAADTILILTNLSELPWAQITGQPDTLAGYGITDAFVPARAETGITTGVITAGSNEQGVVALGKSGKILKVAADVNCWVRFYPTAAARTADASRLISEDPAVGDIVLADLIFAGAPEEILCAPVLGYYNDDGTVVTDIYYRIDNTSGGDSAIQVDVTHIEEEV